MKVNSILPLRQHGLKVLLILILTGSACKSENSNAEAPSAREIATNESSSVNETETNLEGTAPTYENELNEDPMTNTEKTQSDTTKKGSVSLPTPTVELPEISYDKKKLSRLLELDEMLTDAEVVKVAEAQFREMFKELKDSNGYGSLDGDDTPEGKNRAINKVADVFKKFNETGKPLGKKVLQFVKDKYVTDDKFSSKYRDIYAESEEQAREMIVDSKIRNTVLNTEMYNTYRYVPGISTWSIKSGLEEAVQLKREAIGNLLRTADIDIMLAENSKDPNSVAKLLTGTANMLKACQVLEPENEDAQAIKAMEDKVEAMKKKRVAEIKKAQEDYRFPARYNEGNTPANYAALEKKMEDFLKRSTYNGQDKYDVRKSVLAGPWFTVRHELTGVVMYHQIDFYVAIKYKHADPGIIDIDFVTMKTSGANMETFGTFSIGSLAEMHEKNLIK